MRHLSIPILSLATSVVLLVSAHSGLLNIVVGPKVSTPDGSSFDGFSNVMALSRDVLAVGVPGEDIPGQGSDVGAVYLFHRENGGPDAWQFFQRLTASDGERGSGFGSSLTFMDNVLAIGARGQSLSRGAVYLFSKQEIGLTGNWVEVDTLTASDAETGDRFGAAVAADGDVLAVGAPGADAPGMDDQGAAYVFRRNTASTLLELEILTPGGDGGIDDEFGTTVAVSGNAIAVGAPKTDVGGANERGAVYVFDYHTPEHWDLRTQIIDTVGNEGDNFGSSLALSARFLAIGQPNARVAMDNGRGNVHLYQRDGTSTFFGLPRLTVPDGKGGDQFGYSVSLFGDTLAVGARFASIVGETDRGAVYLFRPDSGGVWSQEIKFTSGDGVPRDNFGSNVVLSGDTLAVGAPSVTINGNSKQGAAYMFAIDQYRRWAIDHFGEPTVADTSLRTDVWGEKADPDGDCLENALEAYFGTDPNNAEAAMPQEVGAADGQLIYRWHRDPDQPGIAASVAWSPDLKDWYASGSGPQGDQRTIQIRDRGSLLTHHLETIEASISVANDEQVFLRINF